MTSSVDRRHRIQQYPIPMVTKAINEMVYGDDNRRIMTDLFISNATYENVAYKSHLSVRGLYKRVDKVGKPMEEYLKKLS